MAGTLVMTMVSSLKTEAAIMGSTPFFDPCTGILPRSFRKPLTCISDTHAASRRFYILSYAADWPKVRRSSQRDGGPAKGAASLYRSRRIWLDTLRTIPISTIRNSTEVPP